MVYMRSLQESLKRITQSLIVLSSAKRFGGRSRKVIQLISYTYPEEIKLMIRDSVYTYESSEYWCRKLQQALGKKGEWRAFNRFKKQSSLIKKEVVKSG